MLPVLDIVRAHNPGAAFSFLADAGGWQRWVFSALAVGVSIAAGVLAAPAGARDARAAGAGLALILGGAIGNVIDRIEHGYVVDFVQRTGAARTSRRSTSPTRPSASAPRCVILDALREGAARTALKREQRRAR